METTLDNFYAREKMAGGEIYRRGAAMSDPTLKTESQIVRPEQNAWAELVVERPQLLARQFGMTDRGRVRDSNEDQFLVATLVKSLEVAFTSLPQASRRQSSDHAYLMVVADGVGGSVAGEEASALAIDSVETYVTEMLKWFGCCSGNDDDHVLADFRRAIALAHGRVRAEAQEHPKLRGMGTTLTLAYSVNEELYLAHVGDSRCYLLRDGTLYRLTQDHSLVEEMVRRGKLTPEQAAQHRWRHVITSTVGGDSPDVRIDVHRLQLETGDVLLLCSDGLTEMVTQEQIAEVLLQNEAPEVACRQLVALANEAGGKDNITVVVARYELLMDAGTDVQ
jgi:protein phosphatase